MIECVIVKKIYKYIAWTFAAAALCFAVITLFQIVLSKPVVALNECNASFSLGRVKYADTPGVLSDWKIKFNPSGTHVQHDYMKIRLDFYPSESSKIYSSRYFFNEETGLYQLNPAICHFIKIPFYLDQTELEQYLKEEFNAGVVSEIDDILVQENSGHLLESYFKLFPEKLKCSDEKVPPIDESILSAAVNESLGGFIISGDQKGTSSNLPGPGSITAGAEAKNRAIGYSQGYTVINDDVKTSAAGSITYMEVYLAGEETVGMTAAMFYIVSGSTLHTTDNEYLGTCPVYTKTPFSGLDIDCSINGIIGLYTVDGNVAADTSGYGGSWYKSGDQTSPDTETTYSSDSDAELSIYGTGNESGNVSISNSPSSKGFGYLWINSIYWSNTGNATGFSGNLTDADAFFEITNDGSASIDVAAKCDDFSGGVSCNLTFGTPGLDEIRLSLFKEGDGTSDNLTLSTEDQEFITSLASSASISWEAKLETGSWSDTDQKTGTIYLTASAS